MKSCCSSNNNFKSYGCCCSKIICVTGPTGPQGLKGEAGIDGKSDTIVIRNTVTANPGEEAKVIDVGNENMHVLDFIIPMGKEGNVGPKGEKGDMGSTGPQGEKGEAGIDGKSDTIVIRNTVTANPGEEAKVIDVGNGNMHVLDFIIPMGKEGSVGPKGEKGDMGETGPKGEKGKDGNCERIEIAGVKTLDAGMEAKVEDNFLDNTHHLTIFIPKGEKGEIGPVGPKEPIMEGSTEGMLFASFSETNISGLMNVQESNIIPTNSKYFEFVDNTEIKIKAGTYEIAFSGAIEDVDNSHGGIFYVRDSNGQVVMDLSFKLPSGLINQMHFSQNVLFEFKNDSSLQVMAGIMGDYASSKVKISDVNLLLKKIYV